METNALPVYDDSDNPTGCCPKFSPKGWDGVRLHFKDKPFVSANTRSMMHVPLDMGRVFQRVQNHIAAAHAYDPGNFIVLSRDLSPWSAEHLFAVSASVPEEDSTTLSGDFITKVFEGPFREARHWHHDMQQLAGQDTAMEGEVYFFYTTCPKCAKFYGKNYVVGVARTNPEVDIRGVAETTAG